MQVTNTTKQAPTLDQNNKTRKADEEDGRQRQGIIRKKTRNSPPVKWDFFLSLRSESPSRGLFLSECSGESSSSNLGLRIESSRDVRVSDSVEAIFSRTITTRQHTRRNNSTELPSLAAGRETADQLEEFFARGRKFQRCLCFAFDIFLSFKIKENPKTNAFQMVKFYFNYNFTIRF